VYPPNIEIESNTVLYSTSYFLIGKLISIKILIQLYFPGKLVVGNNACVSFYIVNLCFD